eukprot:15355231-Ditylum_brightwellii.AAC.1
MAHFFEPTQFLTYCPQRIMPHNATKARVPSKKTAPKTNKKGSVVSWSNNSADGHPLKEHTAGSIKKKCKQFVKYSKRMLSSDLTNMQSRRRKEVKTRILHGSSEEEEEEENETYNNDNEDEDEEDKDLPADNISCLSMNNKDYSYDTTTTAYRSHTGRGSSILHRHLPQPKFHGSKPIMLPYLLDLWQDSL